MLDQSGHISAMAGTIPLGRGLMPEEVADFKAKGREWSRLYKEKRRKDFSLEQIEERKLKNRLRQKRFRERQKNREQEETERLANSLHQHQLTDHKASPDEQTPQQEQPQQQQQQQGYEHNAQMQYAAAMQMSTPAEQQEAAVPVAIIEQQQQPVETLVEKRKRLGRERQARFREKKRMRTPHSGSQGNGGESSQAGMSSGTAGQQHEVMTLAELQKMSAQLSGYYTGLTQGLTQEEHQAVMRFFLEGLREDLGDEIFAGVGFYGIADAHAQAQAAAAHVHYMQGIDLQALQQAAAASGHLPQADMPSSLHANPVEAAHMAAQLHSHHAHMEHQMAAPNQAGDLSQAQVQAHFEHYQRHLAEAQQAELGHHHDENYEAGQAPTTEPTPDPDEAQSQHIPANDMETDQERIMYQQENVSQDAMQPGQHMHFVESNQSGQH